MSRRHSVTFLLVALVSALLATLPGVTAASAAVPAATPAHRPPMPKLTVVAYNIHHAVGVDQQLDLERIARVIETQHPDVVQLSEVDKFFGDRSGNLDQAAWLGQRLRMQVAFGRNLDLDPLTPGAPRREFGTAVLSRFPIVSARNTLLPLAPGGEQRGLLQVQVRTPWGPVRILGTHLQHTSTQERLDQVAAIKELTKNCLQPTVLMGDLNAYPDSPEMANLLEKFRDSWPVVGRGAGFTFDSDDPKGRIDYVLTRNLVFPLSARVIATQASDHLPVRVDLAFVPWPLRGC
ncbi:endonuclease/exonuclease/phosphatase family protein [Nakamurella sp. A5-74]|uniref:Endonuclease/exonuclease/phosphatase family protein n=1 Tax=Nakamurella sp. A5-74 TaxID=3158264 RepID=A0AAU8DQA6_9ACTN